MSTPDTAPQPENHARRHGLAVSILRGLGLVVLMAAVSLGAAFLMVELRMNAIAAATAAAEEDLTALRQATLEEVAALREELQGTAAQLQAEMQRVQEAAVAAGVLLEQDGELTGLEARLREIDALKLDLQSARQEMDAKLQALEKSLKDQLASSEQETAAALSLEMSVKGLLIKAQGEILLAQVYWAEGNRGLARDELAIAHQSLLDALEAAPTSDKPDLQKLAELSESTRAALILESTSARDQLNLLWHEVSARLSR